MLTADQIKTIANFDPDTIAALSESLGTSETVSAAGALSVTAFHTKLAVTGAMAFTLAAPTVEGQRKKISCESGADTPVGTLTITSPDDTTGYACAASFVFDTPGQSVELVATKALKWRAVRVERAGGAADNVVVGTTALTGKLWKLFACSVDGTKDSTGTKALPNGSAVGERCVVGCSTASNTPIGSLDFAGRTILGAAVTHMQAIGATTDTAVLEWDGEAWQVVYSTGITLA